MKNLVELYDHNKEEDDVFDNENGKHLICNLQTSKALYKCVIKKVPVNQGMCIFDEDFPLTFQFFYQDVQVFADQHRTGFPIDFHVIP